MEKQKIMKPTGCQRKLEDCQSKSQGLAAECNFCYAGLFFLFFSPSNRSKRVSPLVCVHVSTFLVAPAQWLCWTQLGLSKFISVYVMFMSLSLLQ